MSRRARGSRRIFCSIGVTNENGRVMKYANRISAAQMTFIREVRDGELTLDELKKREKEKAKQLGRWFRNKFFCINLKKAVRQSERVAELEMHLIAVNARVLIAEAVKKKEGLKADEL